MIDKIDFAKVNKKRSQLDMSFYAPEPTPSDVFMLLDMASEMISGMSDRKENEYTYLLESLIREKQGYE